MLHTIEATPLLLGVLAGFVMGMITGLGIALARVTRREHSLASLDTALVAFALGFFISFALR